MAGINPYMTGAVPSTAQKPGVSSLVNTSDVDSGEPTGSGVGELQLLTAQKTLREYQAGKANLDKRIIDNEDWWKLKHWKDFKGGNKAKMDNSTSAWLFNSIAGKHADAMDNYPEATALPRSRDDEQVAATITSILPVVLENSDYETTYSDNWWDKLKNGAAVYMVAWDEDRMQGQGDIAVTPIDLLSIYWEPGIEDIQDSKNVFTLALADNEELLREYPQLEGHLSGKAIDKKEYHYDDTVDTSKKSVVVDWYYKIRNGSQTIVHYVKWVSDVILFATENMQGYENGLYNHGKYPFVIDKLYPEKGTPVGYGFIDIMRSPQEYIDRLGDAILHNSEEAARRRYLVKDNCGINEEEFTNIDKRIIHCTGSPNDDNFRALDVPELSSVYLNVLINKTDELKETSGNRDFSQGSTTSGVTAASAIAALQEAGSKLSRDSISASYRAFTDICTMIIELMRQFYTSERTFRITGENGQPDYVQFSNAPMQSQAYYIADQEFHTKEPVFDIKVKAHKKNPYAVVSQNELALQFYNAGFFNPQLADQVLPCIDMMEFEGKEKVRETIQNNGTMYQQLQQLTQIATLAAQALAEKGDTRVMQALQQSGIVEPTTAQTAPKAETGEEGDSQAVQAANKSREATSVK